MKDKVTNPSAQSLLEEANRPASPLDLLGTREQSENLLDEMMKGSLPSPTPHPVFKPVKGFGGIKEEALSSLRKEEAAAPVESEPEVPKAETPELPEAPPPDTKKEEVPPYFHTLNQQTEALLERQERIERALLSEQQRQVDYQRQLAQQATAPQEEFEYDFTDPAQVKAFRENTVRSLKQEVMQAQVPLLQQMVLDRFNGAVAEMRAQYEHFDEYFKPDRLNSYIVSLLQKHTPADLMKVDWKQEGLQAYRAADYERIVKQIERQEESKKTESKAKEEARQEQKANLKLVPKANVSGAAAKPSLDEELAPFMSARHSFGSLGREMRKKLLG